MVIKPSSRHTPVTSGQVGPTPIADFVIGAISTVMAVIFVPIMIVVFLAIPAWGLVTLVAQPTGLLDAWAGLVASVSTPIAAPAEFAVMMTQNLVVAACVSALVSLPYMRRALEPFRVKWLAEAIDAPQAWAAAQVGVSCLGLHVALGAGIAALLGLGGFALPGPEVTSVVNAGSIVGDIVGGGGGGWPPGAEALGQFAIITWMLIVLCALFIAMALGAGVAVLSAAGSAMGGAASAAGAVLGAAWTSGEQTGKGRLSFKTAIGAGIWRGVAVGAVYTAIVLAGAAVIGVG
ncbi:MAG: hypothetical protein Q8R82_00095 [Hyphomonadaceae bacterium]|nr:hypothetical protein [Hyphomonadaceae bacterium]